MKNIPLAIFNKLASPILTKELRGTFRRWLFFTVFTGTLGVVAIVVLIIIFSMYAGGMEHVSADDIGRTIFHGMLITQGILLVLLLPGFCSTFISGERSLQSYDMLITTRLKPWEIIWGKLLAAGAYICTFLLATLPLVSLSFLYGGVSPGQIIIGYSFLLVLGVLIAVISISVSGLFKSVVWSVIVNYLVVFLVLLIYSMLMSGIVSLTHALHRRYVSMSSFFSIWSGTGIDPLLEAAQWLIYFIILIAFFITAVNRVKPFSANRSTALRIYSLAVMVIFLGIVLAVGLFTPTSPFATKSTMVSTWGEWFYTLMLVAFWGMAIFFFVLYLMLYPVEHNRQSVRVLRKMFRYPVLLRPFFPGGRTGLQYTVISAVIWIGVIMAPGLAFGGKYMSLEQQSIVGFTAAYVLLFIISYALIGFWLSTTKLPQWGARLMLLVIMLCNTIVPWLAASIIASGSTSYSSYWDNPLHYISPIGAIRALDDYDHNYMILISLSFHLVIICIFGVIAMVRSRKTRTRQLEAVRSMPLQRPSAEPAEA